MNFEQRLARAEEEKEDAIRAKESTQEDLNTTTDQITELTSERNEQIIRNTQLEVALSKSNESVKDKDAEIYRLTALIAKIEGDKAKNYETGLIVARRHSELFSGWEKIDWERFTVPPTVRSPVPSYFLQNGGIKRIVRESRAEGSKRTE